LARSKWERPEDSARALMLQESRADLLSALGDLALEGEGTKISRIHGDFHLGQILVASGDVYIIDFEGEPTRPFAERRVKTSPLRDVAGLLRSFDYVAATLINRDMHGAAPVSAERRDAFVESFRATVPKKFLSAYREAVRARGEDLSEDVLRFFMIEKAAFEVRYETANRPNWISIPLAGFAALATGLLASRGVTRVEI
jgi:maltose alpha-D-glucosyltransferase / alpha-amylase